MSRTIVERHIVPIDSVTEDLVTRYHPAAFWEELGKTVATFGFLEETLTKAAFAFTATKPIGESDQEKQLEEWAEQLEKSLSEPLGPLIDRFQKAANGHPELSTENMGELCQDLRKAAKTRNALCHGSWRKPDQNGASRLFYYHKKLGKFDDLVDLAYLSQVRQHTCELAVNVINTVTHMGYSFPGSSSPGKNIT